MKKVVQKRPQISKVKIGRLVILKCGHEMFVGEVADIRGRRLDLVNYGQVYADRRIDIGSGQMAFDYAIAGTGINIGPITAVDVLPDQTYLATRDNLGKRIYDGLMKRYAGFLASRMHDETELEIAKPGDEAAVARETGKPQLIQ